MKVESHLLHSFIEQIPSPVFIKNLDGNYTGCNQAFSSLTGIARDKLVGKTVFDVNNREMAEICYRKDQELLKNGNRQRYRWRLSLSNGDSRDVIFEKALLLDVNGRINGIIGVLSDITELQKAETALNESNERLETLLFMLPVGIVLIDYETRLITDMNPYAVMILGVTKEQVVGRKCHECICPTKVGSCPIQDPEMEIDRSEGELIHASGERIPVFKSAITTKFDGKNVILQCFQDISEIKKLEKRLKEMAQTDFLTGLSNRMFFFDRAHQELSRSLRYQRSLSVVFFDIDYFKRINDQFGHPAGDAVLRRISGICRDVFRQSDIIGRIGGEEFGVILVECDLQHAEIVAERLRQRVASEVFEYENIDIRCTISLGIAACTGNTEDIDSLMKRADIELYRAKNSGRNCVCKSE
jgi:diguanylate cyclase (GGDEF)-like protein/PAS domain S-box-containing protein